MTDFNYNVLGLWFGAETSIFPDLGDIQTLGWATD